MKMFFIILVLVAALGACGDDECAPECSKTLDFAVNVIKLEKALDSVQDGLPSNDFFTENCEALLEYLDCYRQGCGLRHAVIDLDALVRVTTEFCNEESPLRKAYVDHVDCFNTVQFPEDSCVSSFMRATEDHIFPFELRESVEKKSIDRFCLFSYIFATCVVDATTAKCGKAAGRAAANGMNSVMDIVMCNPGEKVYFDSISEFFEDSKSEHLCNSTKAACDGQDEIMATIEAQKVFPSDEDLKTHCSQFKKVLTCPAERARECGEPSRKKNVADYEELLGLLNNICDENSALRASYLRSVSCYNNISGKLSACSYETIADINRFMVSEIFSPLPFGIKAPLKYTCLTMDLVPRCQIREAAVNCGAEAGETLGKLLLSLQKLSLSTNCNKLHMAIWQDDYFWYLLEGEDEC